MGRSLVAVIGTFFCGLIGGGMVAGLPATARVDFGPAAPPDVAGQVAVFPLSVASSKRYLQDAQGRPFLIHGDAAWSIIAELSREEAELYLLDRQARGFNTLLIELIEHRFSTNAPANAYGQVPFTTQGDFTTQNMSYFAHADWVLRRAGELGFLVLLAPAFAGFDGGVEGWYREMVASGPDKLRVYGRFLGQRYQSFKNIIWVHGGDYNPPDQDLVRAIAEGIAATAPHHLHTAHCAPETAALDFWSGEPWLTLNNVYTYKRVRTAASRQHRRIPQMPFFLIESAYENEHGTDGQRLRMQAYDALLSGAAGQVFGNNPIWHFDGPGLHPTPLDWRHALGSPGAVSMRHLRNLMENLAWWTLEPAQGLIVNVHEESYWGRLNRWISSSVPEPAVGARSRDRSFAVVYLPSERSITINLTQLVGAKVTAHWFDPTSGSYLPAGVDLSQGDKTHALRPPGPNRGGFGDWVLVLRSRP